MKFKFYEIANWFYPVYMLIFFFGMLGIHITAYLGYPLIALIVIAGVSLMVTEKKRSKGRSLMLAWMIYNAASIVMYAVNGLPIACYIAALRNYFFPFMFFFIGNWSKDKDDKFYNIFMISGVFFLVVGLYLYYVMPSFYLAFLSNAAENVWYSGGGSSDEELIWLGHRFTSFSSSSYDTSAISVTMMICAFGYMYRPHKLKKMWLYALAIIGLIGAILCQQRVAMASSMLVLLVFSLYGSRHKNRGTIVVSTLVVILGIFALGFAFSDARLDNISEIINLRFDQMSINEAMGQRTGQIDRAWGEILTYLILGKGMGAGGHAATMHGGIGIHDNGYFQLLLEFGVVGMFIFLALMGSTVVKGIKNFKLYNIETMIIIYFLLCNIGEDVFSQSFFITPIFWFCMGRMWNQSYRQQRLLETAQL